MRRLGIIGFGDFGRFAALHLRGHFEVAVADREPPVEAAAALGLEAVTVEEAGARELVVLAVPVQDLRPLVRRLSPHWSDGALAVDVASVRQRPAEILDEELPGRVRFVGLHPMFGPQSGRDGIEGLKVVLARTTSERGADADTVACVRAFLEGVGLEVLEMSAEEHDREMAYIQGLTHWIAKALREIHLPDLRLATPAYRHLVRIEEILAEDSLDLFVTIQRENPFAAAARSELLRRLREIEELIEPE